jgi:hypothetical protein
MLGNAISRCSGVGIKKEFSIRIFILSVIFVIAFPEIATAADELTCLRHAGILIFQVSESVASMLV